MRELQKGVRYEKAITGFSVVDGKDYPAGFAGSFEGYASTWDVDSYGEQFVPGAFAKTISERIAEIPVMVTHIAHGGDANDVIGRLDSGKEDAQGLFVVGLFHDNALSQDMRGKVREGIVKKMSVGFELIRWEVDRSGGNDLVKLKEAKLLDVVLTMNPVNAYTAITAAKEALEAAAAHTGTTGRAHVSAKEACDLAIQMRLIADKLESIATEPGSTEKAKTVAAHYGAELRRRRLELLQLSI